MKPLPSGRRSPRLLLTPTPFSAKLPLIITPPRSPLVYIPQSTRDLIAHMKSDPNCVIKPGASSQHEVVLARAPGRLDVMGGIADYTGSLVCEMPLDVSTAVAVQRRDDRKVFLESYNVTTQSGGGATGGGWKVEFSLDDLYGTAALLPLDTIRAFFSGDRRWAAYVAGAYWVLGRHRKLNRRTSGANIVCHSNVPLGGGVSSSAALEVAALSAITTAYHLILDPLETAVLAQLVENQIVGAPCGVMDQVTSMMGRKGKLLLLKCQPHEVQGFVDIPPGLTVCGINSNVKHSVGGSSYRNTRVAAFMAHALIARAYQDLGVKADPTKGYLANITPELYRKYFRPILPKTMLGRDFLKTYTSIDRVTTVDPATRYTVRAAADHHILENARVHQFTDMLDQASTGSPEALLRAGRLMLASHCSYGRRAMLGSRETDLLVTALHNRGPRHGVYGAKITGGGSGGTVAVLCQDTDQTRTALHEICANYHKQTGLTPQLLLGSSEGAAETGPLRMSVSEIFA